MLTLAMDTCDRFGSVVTLVDGRPAGLQLHPDAEEYSSWLLPAVESSLVEAGKMFADLELLAVATGPGSFTAVRVGLTAVKALSEVYAKRVVGVSRLEAMASSVAVDGWIAASYDAHRGQDFAALYRRASGELKLIEDQMVIAPADFLSFVQQRTGADQVRWVAADPETLVWPFPQTEPQSGKYQPIKCSPGLAIAVGALAEQKAACGEFTDILQLEANYVRRSDAEIYWKGPAHRGG